MPCGAINQIQVGLAGKVMRSAALITHRRHPVVPEVILPLKRVAIGVGGWEIGGEGRDADG